MLVCLTRTGAWFPQPATPSRFGSVLSFLAAHPPAVPGSVDAVESVTTCYELALSMVRHPWKQTRTPVGRAQAEALEVALRKVVGDEVWRSVEHRGRLRRESPREAKAGRGREQVE